MRICNGRSLNSALEGRNFDKCFSVEEANRQIGWSIWRNRSLQSHDIDEKKGKRHSILKNSNQVFQAEKGKKADVGNKLNMPADDQEDGSSCDVAVDSTISPTSSYSQPEVFVSEKDLPIKKRKGDYGLVTETESVEVHEIIGEMVPEKTVEPKKRRRSGRNMKSRYPTYAVNHLTKFKFIERKRKPKRQLANQNNRWEKMQMPEGRKPTEAEDEKAKRKRSWEMANDLSKPIIILALPATSGRSDQIVRGVGQGKLKITQLQENINSHCYGVLNDDFNCAF